MSFWNTSSNAPVQATGSFEMTTDLAPIPSNTVLRAVVTEAKWDEYQGDHYISLRWDVIEGEHKGRVVFQKIRAKDADPKKRDKAITMLAAIDANAGGSLMRSGQEPTDIAMMQALCNKPMQIRVKVWAIKDEATGETKQGNWIDGVFANNGAAPVQQPQSAPAPAPVQQQPTFDDDIAF